MRHERSILTAAVCFRTRPSTDIPFRLVSGSAISLKSLMHLHLRVGETSSGKPAFEPVHVVRLVGNRYRVEFTPGLAYGIAAGDEIEVGDDGHYSVLARGGNVAVRVLWTTSVLDARELTEAVEQLTGRLDGRVDKGLAYTLPVEIGFNAIEKVFGGFVADHPDCVWEYGNVYAEDGSAIGWWESKA